MRRSTVLGLGGGESLWDDLDALEEMMGGPWPGIILVCNDVGWKAGHGGRIWDGPVDHWCTLHAEKLAGWKQKREKAGLPRGYQTWSSVRRTCVQHHFQGWTGGSSGLYMTGVALKALRHPRIVLCGVPMDGSVNTFSSQKWAAHGRYRRGWERELEYLRPRVRSFSGWTRKLFGLPTVDWIGLVHRAERT